MFEDSMVTLMVMLLLSFVGMLVMFLFVIRSNTLLTTAIKELARQQQSTLADMERHLMDISYNLREGDKIAAPAKGEDLSTLLTSIGEAEEALNRSIRSNVRRKAATSSGLPDLNLAGELSQP